MDGADLNPVPCPTGTQDCTFTYVDPTEVQPYFQMAEQYTFANRIFHTNQGPSFPAHQFIISGTSAPTATSNLFASENPAPGRNGVGCGAPSNVTVALIDPTGNESATQFPCFEHET